MEQENFDRLALFFAVASELKFEPFLSKDNHERLGPMGSERPAAHFCHPAFLKSALMPFRKLWLRSEQCSFEKVRGIVFEHHHDRNLVSANQSFFVDWYSRTLNEPADSKWAAESTQEILDMWIYTQAIHAGQRENSQGKIVNERDASVQDFDRWVKRIGRVKFEFLFRLSLRQVGDIYVQFLDKLAAPLFLKLTQDGMVPGFEADAALKFSPYPDLRHNITFDDVFWHLDKESMEDTFHRLLVRQQYGILRGLLRGLFGTIPAALSAVCESADFTSLFDKNGVTLLPEQPPLTDELISRNSTSVIPFGPIVVDVLKSRRVWFDKSARATFEEIYLDFRTCLFEERKRQRRPRSWDDLW